MPQIELPHPGTEYEDDLSISDEDRIFRIIPAFFKYDDEGTISGIESQAFQDASPETTIEYGYPAVGMSVHVESIIQTCGLSPADHLLVGKYSESGLAVLTVGQIREIGQGLVLKPEPDLPAHALAFTMEGSKKNRRMRQRLSELADIYRLPASFR